MESVSALNTTPAPVLNKDQPQGCGKAKEKERNDNSNPQQGTGSPRQAIMPTTNEPNGNGNGSTSFGKPQTENQQQFYQSPSGLRPSLKIPPTKKDPRKLFVGGLPADITSDEFRAYFEKFGTLIDCIVMFDQETNRSRGFGFVSYDDPEVARKLLMTGNEGKEQQQPGALPLIGRMEMRGKMIEVKAAQPKESTFDQQHQRGGGRHGNRNRKNKPPHLDPSQGPHPPVAGGGGVAMCGGMMITMDPNVGPAMMFGGPSPHHHPGAYAADQTCYAGQQPAVVAGCYVAPAATAAYGHMLVPPPPPPHVHQDYNHYHHQYPAGDAGDGAYMADPMQYQYPTYQYHPAFFYPNAAAYPYVAPPMANGAAATSSNKHGTPPHDVPAGAFGDHATYTQTQ